MPIAHYGVKIEGLGIAFSIILSIVLTVLGISVLIANPLNLIDFPQNISLSSVLGLGMLMFGALGLYYGFWYPPTDLH